MAARKPVVGVQGTWKAPKPRERAMPKSYRSIGGRDIAVPPRWKFYVVNQTLQASGKMADNDGAIDTYEEAVKIALKRLREYVSMRFEYLLPVLVVEAPNKSMATLPLAAEGNFDDVRRRIRWVNGKETSDMRIGAAPTGAQLKFDAPGFARKSGLSRTNALKGGPSREEAIRGLQESMRAAQRAGRKADAAVLAAAIDAERRGIDTREWELPAEGLSTKGLALGAKLGTYQFDRGLTTRQKIGALMQQYHASMGDPYYAVGSYYYSGREYPDVRYVERARDQAVRDLALAVEGRHGWGKQEARELAAIAKYLNEVLSHGLSTSSKSMKLVGLASGREIHVGDKLWFTTPHGTKSGIVKLIGPHGPVVALSRKSGGSSAGTPRVVSEESIIQHVKGRRPIGGGRLER